MNKLPKGFKTNLEYAAHLKKEAAIEKQQERFDTEETSLEAAYGKSDKAEKTTRNQQEIKDDWEYLRSIAKAQFPEGVEHLALSPNNRLVAIAACLGWSQAKIAKAAKIARQTVSRWLDRPDLKIFMNEFNMKRGTEGSDVMTKFTELEYKAVMCVDKILSDPDNSDATRRLKMDASKWVFERNRGKSIQTIEHRGDSIKAFIEALNRAEVKVNLSDQEEEELFKEVH